jgi:hypothetical protein
MRAFSLVLLTLTLATNGVGTQPSLAQATPTASPGLRFTPVIQEAPSPPRWFNGADERIHLTYELFLTNALSLPVDVTAIDVLDAATENVIARLDGDALRVAMSLLSTPGTEETTLPPSTVGVVWFDLLFATQDEIPETIAHRLTVALPPGLTVPESISTIGAQVEVDLRPPVVLGPPLLGENWVAAGSCCDGPHRRAFQALEGDLFLAQRFAIDFNQLDANDRISAGDLGSNASFPSYGQPVVAVADAVVVKAVDGIPDQTPGQPLQDVTFDNADGNHVILDLGDGRFALFAHLKPGSVAVAAGDRVTRGQLIGELGNSGSSTGPHLHFHVMDAPSALVADGLPYVFDAFELTGAIPPLAEALMFVEAQEPLPIDTQDAGPRRNALPLGSDVIDFPKESNRSG